ncbi:hypothetical protein [Paenibacillus hexagrammi]|uniref:Methyltransferase n=1 Tax=Paenibacillus hexagrammi TaxID=2908839 RepID=A0ABY3SN26_9BACL|nr:hypothetical protein [Paenibacillus sp. YPD9-1]UJF34525.1 hypothetical protein L0M14_04900 [Paenibacillus sp. YPD9-1]
MSRKWERMVSQNTKKANKLRTKQGKSLISEADKPLMMKGRSLLLPLLFIIVFIFLLATYTKADQSGMYIFTICGYLLIALLMFFVRRPYLKIGKNTLAKRGYSRELTLEAANIKQIVYKTGVIVIELDNKTNWVYSKRLNWFDVAAIAEQLKRFADMNQVVFSDQTQQVS